MAAHNAVRGRQQHDLERLENKYNEDLRRLQARFAEEWIVEHSDLRIERRQLQHRQETERAAIARENEYQLSLLYDQHRAELRAIRYYPAAYRWIRREREEEQRRYREDRDEQYRLFKKAKIDLETEHRKKVLDQLLLHQMRQQEMLVKHQRAERSLLNDISWEREAAISRWLRS